ncbi:N-acetyltransferase 9 [Xenopus laevis]|nr:N-acetyltransferase 9 [Xenopus laevis]XP_018093985.1 N-acetyltransferase 9 [Xenopus laevis]XP_041435079.1 N-acetyltransferase 9 [Xenopus laevis]XP_041435080.1 N-acetyltransferase 9 [Xenopus laevis]XP_041435081.1 N-acetyltransferase 9 [Xenopus laevis]
MRENENTVLRGQRVLLVPYERHHVPRYHEWMKSEELQKLTASEPLTLEQEYGMQQSWREDADKCTFIILDAVLWDQGCPEHHCMVGDVNLFLTEPDNQASAEIEVMIAEPSFRGRGLGEESVRLMLSYGITVLGITIFEAKIGQENLASIRLFKKLHFQEASVSEVFQEVTLRWEVTEQERHWLTEATPFQMATYSEIKQSITDRKS